MFKTPLVVYNFKDHPSTNHPSCKCRFSRGGGVSSASGRRRRGDRASVAEQLLSGGVCLFLLSYVVMYLISIVCLLDSFASVAEQIRAHESRSDLDSVRARCAQGPLADKRSGVDPATQRYRTASEQESPFIGWSDNHFNNLHFMSSLETTHGTTCFIDLFCDLSLIN